MSYCNRETFSARHRLLRESRYWCFTGREHANFTAILSRCLLNCFTIVPKKLSESSKSSIWNPSTTPRRGKTTFFAFSHESLSCTRVCYTNKSPEDARTMIVQNPEWSFGEVARTRERRRTVARRWNEEVSLRQSSSTHSISIILKVASYRLKVIGCFVAVRHVMWKLNAVNRQHAYRRGGKLTQL